MTKHILEAQVVHGPDPKHFLSVVLGHNDSIQIVKLNEVRILKDKLSEQIYAYYKHLAGSVMLDKRFRQECQNLGTFINRYCDLMENYHTKEL